MNILDLIESYYGMQDGEHIKDFNKIIYFENHDLALILKYRVLKHIVEQRKRDGYSLCETLRLFADVQDLVDMKNYMMFENKKEVGTVLFIEITNGKRKGVVLVLEGLLLQDKDYVIKTGFYRAYSKIRKLMR